MSGAGARLEQLLAQLRPRARYLELHVVPAVRRVKRAEAAWSAVVDGLNSEQRTALDSFGYASLTKEQLEVLRSLDGDGR